MDRKLASALIGFVVASRLGTHGSSSAGRRYAGQTKRVVVSGRGPPYL